MSTVESPFTVTAYPVVEGRCGHCGRSVPTWTPAAIVTALHEFAGEHGRAPRCSEWRAATPFTPAAESVRELFGTWRAALDAAGLSAPRTSWTKDKVIMAIFEWRYHRGRLPRAHEWPVQTEVTPSSMQVRRLFGSWNAALEAAGYEPTHRKAPR